MKFTLLCSGTFLVPSRSLFVIVGRPSGGLPDELWTNLIPVSSNDWAIHSDWREWVETPDGRLLAFVIPYADEAALVELTAFPLHGRELLAISDWPGLNPPPHDPLPPLDQMCPVQPC